jgi:YaiO family outer membrane protein
MMASLEFVLRLLEALVVLYSVTYVGVNSCLIALAYRPVVDRVRSRGFDDFDLMDEHDSTLPPIAIVVSAYNEATTIVESVRSLMAVDYPSLELVIVNDGSSDETAAVMRRAFRLRRRDVPTRQDLSTATVRACYESRDKLPKQVHRFLFVDKDNGGRADGLNAGLNFCTSPYFLTVDADCIVEPSALKQVTRLMQTDPDVAAIGGQVGVVNDCEVEGGRIARSRIPRRWLPLCQTLEYLRAFSLLRAGFSRANSLVILSGAFMVFRRELTIKVGGFLTGRSPSRLLHEYVGAGRSTVCEDMEIIVRLHRYAYENGTRAKILHTPLPLVWTEVPEDIASLSKQRGRWHRGLIEILRQHRAMLFNPTYGRVGVFSLPYFLWFELMGPYIEAFGFFVLPVLALTGVLSPLHALLITSIALGAGMIQSLLAVLVSTTMLPSSPVGQRIESLLGADSWRDRAVLFLGSFLTELGYRQLTVWWRLRATVDYMRGHNSWDKFERKGFRTATTTTVLLAALLGLCPPRATAETNGAGFRQEATVVVTAERRDQQPVSWWTESLVQWKNPQAISHWTGIYRADRGNLTDYGIIVGAAPPRWDWGGFGAELRVSSGADFSPLWSASLEGEFKIKGRVTGSVLVRRDHYPALDVDRWSPGTVVYLKWNWWWSNHLELQQSRFDSGPNDFIVGWASRLWTPLPHDIALRWQWQSGGESYLVRSSSEARDIRATILGLQLQAPLHTGWKLLTGIDHRRPERGPSNQYWHLGFRREF